MTKYVKLKSNSKKLYKSTASLENETLINLDFSKQAKKLLSDIDVTARARFNAARRCEYLNNLSNWTVSLISLLLISIPILQNLSVSPFGVDNPKLNSTLIILAVFVLVFSQFSNIENYSLRAYKYHECAIKLNKIKRETSLLDEGGVKKDEYTIILNKYDSVIKDYENHSDVDYKLFIWQEILSSRRNALKDNSIPRKEGRFLFFNRAWYEMRLLSMQHSFRYYAALFVSISLVVWAIT